MKLAIIFPPLPFGWTPVAPPILEYLAALTRREDPEIEIEVYSASATPDIFDTLECDLAAISLLTPTSVSGYAIAAKLRSRGAKVVFGGIHASLLPAAAVCGSGAFMCRPAVMSAAFWLRASGRS